MPGVRADAGHQLGPAAPLTVAACTNAAVSTSADSESDVQETGPRRSRGDTVNGGPVVVLWMPGTMSALLERVAHDDTFWFVRYAFRPDSRIVDPP